VSSVPAGQGFLEALVVLMRGAGGAVIALVKGVDTHSLAVEQ
jgi:hypothetical protein